MDENTTLHFLSCRDYTVSGKEFDLYWNQEKDILKTEPVPAESELASYYKSQAYISHTDASRSFVEKLYQRVKNRMLQKKIDLISSFTDQKTLLDIGAGTGDFLGLAKNNSWEVSGIEPNTKARNLASKKGIELFPNKREIQQKQFDAISLWHVLEHIPDLENELNELKKLLKPNGTLFVAVPNFKSDDAVHYKKYWAAYDVPRHLWHFSKEGIERVFNKHQFKLVETKPLIFDAFYVSLLSEKHKTGRINYAKAFYQGLKSNLKAKRTKEYSSHIYIFQHA